MQWVRFRHDETVKFGILDNDSIAVHAGSMFQSPQPTGELLARADVALLPPVNPGKMIGLANNYHCLLYTSPSPRDGLLSRMPSSA